MARYVGDQWQVGFFYESGTYANASGTLHWIGLVQDHTITENENVQDVRYAGTSDRSVGQFVDGARSVEGTITFHPQDWKFLGFALGSVVDAGSPSPYSHTLSEANSNNGNAFTSGTKLPFMSFTLEDAQKGFEDGAHFVRTVKGCVVNSWEVNFSQGAPMSVTCNYVAQSVVKSSGTPTALTEDTTRPFLWRDAIVAIPSGTGLDAVTDVTLTVENNVEAKHYANGSRVSDVPLPQNRDYTLSVTVEGNSEQTSTLYNYFKSGLTFNTLFTVAAADAGAGSRDAFLSFSGCRLTEMPAPSSIEGAQPQTLTIRPQNASVIVADLTQLYNPW